MTTAIFRKISNLVVVIIRVHSANTLYTSMNEAPVPSVYQCSFCTQIGVKLWSIERELAGDRYFFYCASCACIAQNIDVSAMDKEGYLPCEAYGLATSRRIGTLVPHFACYHLRWWQQLPNGQLDNEARSVPSASSSSLLSLPSSFFAPPLPRATTPRKRDKKEKLPSSPPPLPYPIDHKSHKADDDEDSVCCICMDTRNIVLIVQN